MMIKLQKIKREPDGCLAYVIISNNLIRKALFISGDIMKKSIFMLILFMGLNGCSDENNPAGALIETKHIAGYICDLRDNPYFARWGYSYGLGIEVDTNCYELCYMLAFPNNSLAYQALDCVQNENELIINYKETEWKKAVDGSGDICYYPGLRVISIELK